MAILECKNLKFIYGIGTPFEFCAVDGVDFCAQKNEIIGIIGHTGSGKSTFIQHLNGLLKPTEGVVTVNGKDIWSKEN
ncbi:ATP-binding cassette domain-containing protein, partial [Eubacterium sp.]